MNLKNFYVKPNLPEKLQQLNELAENLWSTWDPDAYRLYSRIDPILFRKYNHNPIKLLQNISTEKLERLSQESGFINELNNVYEKFQSYINYEGYYLDRNEERQRFAPEFQIAYFSMEFGLHESLPVYSGGLGVLAGDHLKAASDLGLPLTGFGLLYRYGYFFQRINLEGNQEEIFEENEWYSKPIKIVTDEKGNDLIIKIKIRENDVFLKVWKIKIGKISSYLLDANLEENIPFYRKITDYLYVSDREMRLLQEIVLAFGSLKLIDILNLKPTVFHLNEGHSAFIIPKRLERLMQQERFTLNQAKELIRSTTVFTTHTPVPAGNEEFENELVETYLADLLENIGLGISEFLKLGSTENKDKFSMSALAIRFSKYINGVSKLHTKVSKKMWHKLYPNLYYDEMPIEAITNGVHIPSWLARQNALLLDRYLGKDYLHNADDESLWQYVGSIPDVEIWEAHQQRKQQMITFIRNRLRNSLMYKGTNFAATKNIHTILSPDHLIIGFARRFATYKRANLILKDKDRLLRLIKNNERSIQFVFAGKAHPADEKGKAMIKEILDFARENEIEDKFVFVEDYDMNIARHLVQGVDVWLNNPIKPQEASGTSGMKAGMNGVINLSILDGWWPECYNKHNGWGITAGSDIDDPEVRDTLDANEIYDILENEIVPLFYDVNKQKIPSSWIKKMRRSIQDVGHNFNVHRMLRQYIDKFYIPVNENYNRLRNDNYQILTEIEEQESKLKEKWDQVNFIDCDINLQEKGFINSGDLINIKVQLDLDGLSPEAVEVEFFYYQTEQNYAIYPLKFIESSKNIAVYQGKFAVKGSGQQSFNLRLRPKRHELKEFCEYVKWYY